MKIAWSAIPDDLPMTRDSGDPLGFRAVARRIAQDIVPGFTQRTGLVRGFSLLVVGLKACKEAQGYLDSPAAINEVFLRFERLWVASQVRYHGDNTPFAGKKRTKLYLEDGAAEYDLGRPILTHQLAGGLWGSYRRSSVHFGLIAPSNTGSSPSATALIKNGTALHSVARKRTMGSGIHTPGFPLATFASKGRDPNSTWLDCIPAKGHLPSTEECMTLWQAVVETDERYDKALQRLHRSWVESRDLRVGELMRDDSLSKIQHEALVAAERLQWLMRGIERPYRRWVTGDTADAPSPEVWTDTGWELLRRWDPHDDLERLRATVEPSGLGDVFDAIHEHHSTLAELRGGEAWEPGLPNPTREMFFDEDFRLGVTAGLFEQGLGGS
jgi:hypothetical protein